MRVILSCYETQEGVRSKRNPNSYNRGSLRSSLKHDMFGDVL